MRFPGFEDEWEEILIGDKFNFFSTNSLSRAKLNEKNGIVKNIHYGDIHTKFHSIVNVQKEDIPFISEEVENNKIDKMEACKNGDLLIADASEDYADIGKTIEIQGIKNEKIVGGLHTLMLRDKTNNVSPLFNGYLFQNERLKKEIKIKANGISVLGISKKELEKITIKIPQKEEQKQISDLLFSIDQKISFMEKKYLVYKDIEKYFIQYMLNTINNNLKTPEIRFNEFINDWPLYKLENLSVVKDGTHDSPKYVEDGYPLVTSKNLNDNGTIDFENINYISEEDYDSINKRSNVDKGDILFGMIGTIGNPVIVDKDDFAIKNVALIKEKSNLRNDFLIYYLQSNDILKQFYKFNAGGTQKFIALNLIKNLSIRCPTLKEQEKIQSFLFEISVKVNLIEKEIELNKQFKNSLLSKMFC